MTLRALVVGLLGALFIAGFGYINDQVLMLGSMQTGHLLPVAVAGTLIVAMVTVNPLLFAVRRRWAFRPGEAAVAVMMMLVACSIPGSALMRQFTSILALPAYWNQLHPGYRANRLLSYAPRAMLPAGGRSDPEVTGGFVRGLGRPGEPIGLADVPWGAWAQPLSVWLPLLVLAAVASICLCLIVHRQWTRHERLRYLLAEVTGTLLDRPEDRAVGGLFRRRAFWVGLAIVVGIHAVNGLNTYLEGRGIEIPMQLNFLPVLQKLPWITRSWWGRVLLTPRIYPLVIGFSFFLASDLSFSLGISQYLMVPVLALLISRGVDVSTSLMAGGPTGWMRAGAYAAFGLTILYFGRRYYAAVARAALTGRPEPDVPPATAWAARVFGACLLAMVVVMTALGLPWTLSILTTGMVMLIFLVVSRIAAEFGLFYISVRWQPMGVLLGMLGGYALGPSAMITLGLLSAVLCLIPSQALMPYFINGLKLVADRGVRPASAAVTAGGTYVLALGLAVVVVLWANYNYGHNGEYWSFRRVPTMAMRPTQATVVRLKLAGTLEASGRLGPLQRLANMQPDPRFLWWAGAGFVGVVVCTALRLRLPRWPLHPAVFLLVATNSLAFLHHSLLLGWAIKQVVLRLGGNPTYQRAKPLMIGLIAGDLIAALLFMGIGAVYFAATGTQPPAYQILP